jgi:hypothetical protein
VLGEPADGARPELVEQAHQPGAGGREVDVAASYVTDQAGHEHDELVAQPVHVVVHAPHFT